MKKQFVLIGLLLLMIITLSGCMAGPNPDLDTPDENGKTAGFLTGLWQGIVAPFTFIISLFTDNVNMYEVHNVGGWYDFGFLIGIGAFCSGGTIFSKRRH